MNTKKFSSALGNVDENYIDEAVNYTPKRKKNTWVKWVSIAACLSLIVLGGIFGNLFRSPDTPDVPENNIMSYFTLTAYAANGESTNLNFSGSCINSGKPKYNLFGHDMPLFHFNVEPSDLKNNEGVYERFDIAISYNGTLVDGKDEHILVGYVANVHRPTSKPYAYSVLGWFKEPTDVIVTITDKESKMVVEEITVNVKFDADRQEYELKITNFDTVYAQQHDSATFDIDGDGEEELCRLQYGRTSGVFTFIFLVQDKDTGEVEYKSVIYSRWYDLSFQKGADGVTRVEGITLGDDPETHLFDISIKEGYVYLTENGVPIGEIIN